MFDPLAVVAQVSTKSAVKVSRTVQEKLRCLGKIEERDSVKEYKIMVTPMEQVKICKVSVTEVSSLSFCRPKARQGT